MNLPAPGSEQKKNSPVRSPWREFEFWFMIVRSAIVPRVSISQAIENWPRIRKRLMENARKRQIQTDELSHLI